jgi:hypothetical protein
MMYSYAHGAWLVSPLLVTHTCLLSHGDLTCHQDATYHAFSTWVCGIRWCLVYVAGRTARQVAFQPGSIPVTSINVSINQLVICTIGGLSSPGDRCARGSDENGRRVSACCHDGGLHYLHLLRLSFLSCGGTTVGILRSPTANYRDFAQRPRQGECGLASGEVGGRHLMP